VFKVNTGAGTPYLVRWQDDESEEVHLDFDGMVIKNIHQSISTYYADFVGSFSPVTLNEGNKSVLYLGEGASFRSSPLYVLFMSYPAIVFILSLFN
jgi:hypothetical protein